MALVQTYVAPEAVISIPLVQKSRQVSYEPMFALHQIAGIVIGGGHVRFDPKRTYRNLDCSLSPPELGIPLACRQANYALAITKRSYHIL